MALTDLSRAFADLSTHTKRLEEAKARKAELRLELDAVNASIDAAENAVQTTQRLVKELAARLGQ
jgi:chromosome segregation ATPase